MRRIILIVFSLLTLQVYGQIDKIEAKSVGISSQMEKAVSDTILQVSYQNSNSLRRSPALYINGKHVNESHMKTIDPEQIERIHVVKEDIVIADKKYFGQLYIQMKKDYCPKIISLEDLKLKYTNLTNALCLFMIDTEFISGDYGKYVVDEKYILKIRIENIVNEEDSIQAHIIRLVTKTEENIKKSNEIRLRGTEDLLH